jgi:uncharacterized lipoprotein YddW (UPF0748 family)
MKGDATRRTRVTMCRRIILPGMRALMLLVGLPLAAIQSQVASDSLCPPAIMREFRGVWVATVNNMDWPSRSDLSTADQQRELLAILDRAAELKMNAIVFQVRPEADALYASKYEPWSRYLTGQQGRSPSPFWDPLAFAVAEAHKRGLELHAWFNPYRAAFWRDSTKARGHISRRRPWLVVPYAQYLWMDPGLAEVRQLFIRSVVDVVGRYDIDGVHIDDYFYPYPENNSAGQKIEFPDARTYAAYRRAGGELGKSDWRRRNVDRLIREFYTAVKAEKKWVKVGISPFGIWRPGVPPTTTAGLDQFEELYSDVRKWLREGWLDYVAPQLYWPVRPPEQSYPVLLQWWVDENVKARHVFPGLALYKLPITGLRKMRPEDIIEEILITRDMRGADGHLLFNARIVMDNVDGITDRLAVIYGEPALVPASPWLDKVAPDKPAVRVVRDTTTGDDVVRFSPRAQQRIAWWVVQSRANEAWQTTILPGAQRTHILNYGSDVVSVVAVDRTGNVSAATVIRVPARAEGVP